MPPHSPPPASLSNGDLGGKLPLNVHVDVVDTTGHTFLTEKRVEQADLERSSRLVLEEFPDFTAGCGMSDVVLGTGATHVQGPVPTRWRDVNVAPINEFILASAPLSLVLEGYELTTGPEGVKVRTTMALERTSKHNAAGIAARVRANPRDLVMRDGSGTGSVEVSYDQSRPMSGTGPTVVADYASINLDGQVVGPDKLRITVTDLISGRSPSRSTPLTLVPADAPGTVARD